MTLKNSISVRNIKSGFKSLFSPPFLTTYIPISLKNPYKSGVFWHFTFRIIYLYLSKLTTKKGIKKGINDTLINSIPSFIKYLIVTKGGIRVT